MVKHFENATKKYIKELKLNPKETYIIDVGSNDGVTLKPFKDLKFKKYPWDRTCKKFSKISK